VEDHVRFGDSYGRHYYRRGELACDAPSDRASKQQRKACIRILVVRQGYHQAACGNCAFRDVSTKTTEPSKAKLPSDATKTLANDRVTRYSVTFPFGTEVTLKNNRGEGTYKILAAQVDSRNAGRFTLKFYIRLTNKGPLDLGFWSASFRLLIDGVPRAPTSWLNDGVDARSAKESDVIFEMPDTAESLVLSVTSGPETANIPIILKKSD
jgi:hypothetical protein